MQKSSKKIWILEDNLESLQIFEEILELRFSLQCFDTLLSLESHWLSLLEGDQSIPDLGVADLIIADLRLPDGNFLNFIKAQAERKRRFPPFIVISSVDDLDIMRATYKQGALDYLVKPFKKMELLVKIEHLLEVTTKQTPHLEGDVTIDPIRMVVKKSDGALVKLTAKELQIFTLLYESLYESKDKKVSRTDLFQKIWDVLPHSEKTLDVHISNLRQKISRLGLDISYVSPESYRVIPLQERDPGLDPGSCNGMRDEG